ncbi:unnamed protein product [Cylicocyclus nassatus]|uniref:Peptidase A1 domain-containing protein n=1 Tax=Cylicocyclus nassatus TaxID=53992 RepID=A0AA36M8Q5_CYLNA|nr:unnamed protein product [Cylicocyclus nassatus]
MMKNGKPESPLHDGPALTNMSTKLFYHMNRYYQFFKVGDPGHYAFVLVSTHSSMLWFPHVNCSSNACEHSENFDPNESTSLVLSNERFKSVDTAANATGILASDDIELYYDAESILIRNITFGLALETQTNGDEYLYGLVGLGFENVQGTNTKPFIMELIDQGILEKPIFTIWLNPEAAPETTGGYVTYGLEDDVNCGPIRAYEYFVHPYSYAFTVEYIEMKDLYIHIWSSAEMDLGPFLILPETVAGAIAKMAQAQYDPGSSLYWIDCNAKFPDIKLGRVLLFYTIRASDLIIKFSNDLCVLAVVERVTPSMGPMLIGAPFFYHYCVVFDIADKRLGIAEAKNPSTTIAPETTTITEENTCKPLYSRFMSAMLLLSLTYCTILV